MLGIVPVVGHTQANFVIPTDRIGDFTYYDRIETCYALSNRMRKQLSRKQDSTELKLQIFLPQPVDTTSELLRWNVQQCMQKFSVPSLAHHDSISRGETILDKALQMYYEGQHWDRFITVVDSIMQPSIMQDTGYQRYIQTFRPVRAAIGLVRPYNYTLVDSLEDHYVMPAILKAKQSGDLNAAYTYYEIMLARVDRLYKDSLQSGFETYRQWVARMQSEFGTRIQNDTSYVMNNVRRLIRSTYDKINHTVALDSLRQGGPDGYFNALRTNHKLAGFTTDRDFPNGMTSPMMTPLAFMVHQYTDSANGEIRGTTWRSSKPGDTKSVTNVEYPLGVRGQPYVVFWMNALCRSEHQFVLNEMRKSVTADECWQKYSYIKWFHERYPKISIFILTNTVGHFRELAIADPYKEGEMIKDSWWKFHHLPANIVIYHWNYFTMPDLDQRRQDIENDNMRRYREIPGTHPPDRFERFPTTLVGPDGRILTTLPSSWNAVEWTKEFVDPFYSWWQQAYRSTAEAE